MTTTLPAPVYGLRSISYTVASASTPNLMYIVSVDRDGWHCTCPDATYRRRECKHQRQAKAGQAGEPIIDADRIGHARRIIQLARHGY